MTTNHDTSLSSADTPALEEALVKSQEVQDKMENCAVELSVVNETVKKEFESGSTLKQLQKTLVQSESVEDKVQECAGELHEVNKILAMEVEDRTQLNHELVKTGRKLSAAESILSDT
jgi:hypothetical protein